MNEDDLDESPDDSLGDDSSFDDFEQQNTLGDLWRNNPMVKIGVILAAGVAIFGTIILFGGKEQRPNISVVSGGSEYATAPGTEEVTPLYRKAIGEFNEAEVEQARATGGSALPVPVGQPASRLSVPEDEEEAEDPLQRWRRLQEERLSRELQQRETVDTDLPDTTGQDEAIQALADVMSQQMQSILESQTGEVSISTMQLTDPDLLKNLADEEKEAQEAQDGEDGGDGFEEFDEEEILIQAGSIEYGQVLVQANSDVPGPVLVQIASGPYRGSRLIGTFNNKLKSQAEVLTLNFDTIVIDGISYSADAVALDPETTLPGLASDVDHHYFKRVLLPMAAAFVEGFTEAISQTDTAVVVVQGGTATQQQNAPDSGQEVALGIEEAGQELREILDEEAGLIKKTIIIEAGTPVGILFVEAVKENDEDT